MPEITAKRNKKKGIFQAAANFSWSWKFTLKLLTIGLSFTLGFTSNKVYQRYVTTEHIVTEVPYTLHVDDIALREPEGGITIVAWPDMDGEMKMGLFLPEPLPVPEPELPTPAPQDTVAINNPILLIVNMPQKIEGFTIPTLPVTISDTVRPTHGWGIDPRRESRASKENE